MTHFPPEGPWEDLGFCSLWDQNESPISSSHTGQSQTFLGRTSTSIESESGGAPSVGESGRGLSSSSVVLQFGTCKKPDRPSFPLEPGGNWNQKRKGRHDASNQQGDGRPLTAHWCRGGRHPPHLLSVH